MRFDNCVTYIVAALLATAITPAARADKSGLTAQQIVARSAAATQAGFNLYPNYSHIERDRQEGSDKTYRVLMIDGSPYQVLIAENGKPVPEHQRQQEESKLKQEIAKRKAESPEERRQRIASYERDRKRDNTMIQQLTAAFQFQLLKKARLGSFDVYVLRATPKPGYNPPNLDSEVLPGMEGTMWIDQKTFQWVKVTAHVIHPVSIMGFLAQVQPGTRFELEKRPVSGKFWAPSHFSMRANSKILGMFSHNTWQDQTFSDYRLAKKY
ncbi:MAG TPA: hypothetical protein VLJ11_18480 [Bryobacteraceae bacterium]|nr:hypothetical protein [Bryobacteraceae bacterium]